MSIITSKRLAALPVINEQGKFVGIIGVNALLEMLLPQAVRSALADNADNVPSFSFMDDNMGKLAKRDAPVIYPDSPVMEVVLLLLRAEDVVRANCCRNLWVIMNRQL